MTEEEKLFLLLSQFEISNKKVERILNELGQNISIDSFFKIKDLKNILGEEIYANVQVCASEVRLRQYQRNLQESKIKLLTIFSKDYPQKLAFLPEKPYFLFCKGDLSLLSKKSIAIVGSRTPSNYGRMMTDRFAGQLAQNGVVVVSGLAYGIDSIAHRKALEVGGKTIAVLGAGFNNIYPAEHKSLADSIAEKGLLISEYCPSMKATRYSFPQRNRIIAGLSDGVLITEAGMKSGTIHTKDFALDYGRELFAIPGNITSEKSQLPNDIIRSGQGQCVLCVEDILSSLGMSKTKQPKKQLQLSFEEQEIVDLLSKGDFDIDYLSKNCSLKVNILNSCLTTLEIRGIIKRLPGEVYSLV